MSIISDSYHWVFLCVVVVIEEQFGRTVLYRQMLDVHTKRGVGPELDDTGRCPSRGHGVGIGLQVEDVELGHGELSPTVPAVKINCKQQHLS